MAQDRRRLVVPRLSDDYVRSEYSRINGVGLREWRLPLVRDARSWDALNQPPRFTR